MTIKPLFDRVVLLPEKQESTSNGIFLGSEQKDQPLIGKVLYVGTGNKESDGKFSEMFVKKGDRVLYSKYSGQVTELNQKQVVIIRQTDILAIIEE